MDLNTIGKSVLEIAKHAGEFIIEQRKTFSMESVEQKGVRDFVSYVDKEAEKMIVDGLRKLMPESGFIAEEQTAGNNKEEYLWIIDPLDGTTNFIHNVAPFSISIALQKDKKTILGVVYELNAKDIFFSWDGIDAFCNDSKISVSVANSLNGALCSTGFSVSDFSRLENHLKVVKHVVENSHGLRRHGSAAVDLAYLAAGKFDGFFEFGLNIWDLAAGAYLVEKAGGIVTDYSGGDNFFNGRELCAGAPKVQAQLLEVLKRYM